MITTMLPLLAQASSNGGAAGAAVGGLFMIVFFIVGLAATVFWIWMLIDCLTSSLPSTEKLIWVLVILFLSVIGAVLYFFIGRKNRSLT